MSIVVIFLFVPGVNAAQTEWEDLGLDTSIRLISGNQIVANGTVLAGIELKMPNSIKTYWRIPGDTGVPVQIDISSSSGSISKKIIWPYPERETKYGSHDFVYYGSTIIPIELVLKNGAKDLRADIFLGICSNICIPVRTSLEIELDLKNPDRGHGLRIAQAITDAPLLWDRDEEPFGEIIFDKKTGRLDIIFDKSIVSPQSLIVDNGDVSTLFSPPQTNEKENIVSFRLMNMAKADQLINMPITLTFLTRDGAYQLSRLIKTPRKQN